MSGIHHIDFLNGKGFEAILKSSETQQMLKGHADAIKGRADAFIEGESKGFNSRTTLKGSRWIARVGTSDKATVIAESEQKALTKAVHG